MKESSKQSSMNLRNKQLPIPFLITTQNLIIRPLLHQDRVGLENAIRESIKDLKIWLPSLDHQEVDAPEVITDKLFKESQSGECAHFCVYFNEHLLGICSFEKYSEEEKSVFVNFWCRSQSGRENYFVDGINSVLQYGFRSGLISKFYINCVVGNYIGEITAKQLNFSVKEIILYKNTQVKVFFIDNQEKLPHSVMQVVENFS